MGEVEEAAAAGSLALPMHVLSRLHETDFVSQGCGLWCGLVRWPVPVRTESEFFDLQGCGLWRGLARRPVSLQTEAFTCFCSIKLLSFKLYVIPTRRASVCGAAW